MILTGAGEKAFAAGSDISGFSESRANPEANRRYNAIHERAYDAVYHCRKPTIAMIRGYCIGGGLDFAASCDVRIAADDASFSAPAGKLGLGYGHEGIERIKRVIGLMRARDMFFTGRRLSADGSFSRRPRASRRGRRSRSRPMRSNMSARSPTTRRSRWLRSSARSSSWSATSTCATRLRRRS